MQTLQFLIIVQRSTIVNVKSKEITASPKTRGAIGEKRPASLNKILPVTKINQLIN